MLSTKYNPQKNKQLQILDINGEIIKEDLDPKLDDKTLIKMYETMCLGRIADIKALQFQRQGRMLTYAPNKGQEATQVGAAAALEPQDWISPSFRELNLMLYKGVPLENIFLYWYGNEKGSNFPGDTHVLPVNIIIGSQMNLGAGVALASQKLGKNEVTLATIGDGGTSHGEFYEGINFAAVYKAPMVVLIQNNQYAISTPRSKATRAETLAQKSVAFGIPGIQVDGNDILAMYVATKEAVDRARNGEGPTIIEAYTYRMGPHTTSDDPTLYRTDEEVKSWEKKDPILRFKKYLEHKGLWNDEKEKELEEKQTQYILETFKKVESYGAKVELNEVFEHTYQEPTKQLKEQYEEHLEYLRETQNKDEK